MALSAIKVCGKSQSVTDHLKEIAMSAAPTAVPTADATATDAELATVDLIEEVSIDGMCGVY